MKIAHFSWEYPPVLYGGLGTFAMEMTQKQAELGHHVTVLSLNEANKYPVEESKHNINIYRPRMVNYKDVLSLCVSENLRRWGEHFQFFSDVLSYNFLAADTFVSTLLQKKRQTFDLIDAHDWLGVLAGIVAKKETQLPLVFHIHSTETGRSLGGGSATIKDIEQKGGETADCIITVSHAMKEELIELGFPKEKIQVCWNAVDPEKYKPETITPEEKAQLRKRYGVAEHETVIFFVGRLVTVKGVDKLVEAMPEILAEYPETKLVILGIGDMEQDLRMHAASAGIEDHIIFRSEFVSEHERIRHFAFADVVVLPSLYEPFGIVCTEAMAMAKPVVVGARGTNGMREQIIPSGKNQCGIHINPYDPSDIAWGINQILAIPDKGKQMGLNARKRVLQEFTWDIIAKKTLSIYQQTINKTTPMVTQKIS